MPTQPEIRYLTSDELSRLRRYAESRATVALQKGNAGAVREWALLDTLLSSGLRAAKVAALCISDALLGYVGRLPSWCVTGRATRPARCSARCSSRRT